MTPEHYQQNCFRTLANNQKYWELSHAEEKDLSRERLLLNATLGMAGEAAEIKETPSSDECGDAYWYAYIMMKGLDLPPFAPNKHLAQNATPQQLLECACILCEWIKKLIFHKKSMEVCYPVLKRVLETYVHTIAALDPSDYKTTFEANIDKLKARYPEGFRTSDLM